MNSLYFMVKRHDHKSQQACAHFTTFRETLATTVLLLASVYQSACLFPSIMIMVFVCCPAALLG